MPFDDTPLPPGKGCEECGATDQGVHVEAWETLDKLLCEECGASALEETI